MRTLLVLIVSALSATACDDDGGVTGPSSSGARVEAVVRDTALTASSVTGSLSGNVSASVWNGSRWIDLGSPNGITIPLQQPQLTAATTVHGEQSLPAGSFDRVRVVFQGVTARISRGSVVGGTTLSTDRTVTLGGGDARAELTASVDSFSGEDSATTKRVVVFELRSQQWLTPSSLQSGRVEDSALQAALIATTRTELR